jgi:hypothetical protein
MRPTERCGLCRRHRLLAASHLLPKSLYRLFQGDEPSSRHPLHLSTQAAMQTSAQMKDYLLCDECEDRFSKRGERWTMGHAYRGGEQFKLRELLFRTKPYLSVDGSNVYAGSEVEGLDFASLTYFGASVFWRAAARNWSLGRIRYSSIKLGPYAELLRLYLLDEAPFPTDTISLTVFVSMREPPLLGMHFPVTEAQQEQFMRIHRFHIPGVQFIMSCSKYLRVDQVRGSIAAHPYHYIFTSPNTEDVPAANFVNVLNKHRNKGNKK